MKDKWCGFAVSWTIKLLTAALLPLEPTLKRNQPLCLACKCLTINHHHKTHSGSWLDTLSLSPSLVTSNRSPPLLISLLSSSPTPSSVYSLSSFAVVDAGHMPQCHSPFSFSHSAPEPCDSHQSDADAMVTGPLGECSLGPSGALRALPEQHSPPPHLDKDQGPTTSTVLTLSWPPTSTNDEHKAKQHKRQGRPQDVGDNQPHRNSQRDSPQQCTDISQFSHLLNAFHVMKMVSVKPPAAIEELLLCCLIFKTGLWRLPFLQYV